ncbi:phage major capsid protein [Mesorhizobium helmanticense]|uniref:Phage major capsid protein n=1 Tax=Mesorhizobium helmanticense TaxID=1776423 RepID=A0A2T4IP26_9HYPH|nr:phage major capsid protein [Mesorhizobium helmanticense]PTE07397.1 phage major capsid protein [Mesorhizobium helmanticense]
MNAINLVRTAPMRAFRSEAKAFRCGQWVRGLLGYADAKAFCQREGLILSRAASETTNTAGGVLVPIEFLPELIALREVYGVFRRAGHVAPMRSDLANVPRRTGGVIAYFVDQGQAPAESTGALDGIAMVAKKLAALSRASSEIDEDAAIDLGEWFLAEFAQALALAEDTAGFNGDGTSTYGGITGICPRLLNASQAGSASIAAAGHDTFAEIDITDLTTLISKLPAYAMPGARWFVSNLGFALTLCRLAASAGGIVVQNVDGRNMLTFMGFPVELTQVLPQVATDLSGQVMLCFGDLSLAATLGDRRQVTVAVSSEYKFVEDQVAFKGTERMDINVHDLGDATTAGPIVGLIGE